MEHKNNTVEKIKGSELGAVADAVELGKAAVDAWDAIAENPVVESEATEKFKTMERDAVADAAEAGGLGVETIVKTMGEAAVAAYKVIEEDVVGAYKKVEQGAVEAYKKVEDAFVEKLFAKEGESVEDAKKRLQGK